MRREDPRALAELGDKAYRSICHGGKAHTAFAGAATYNEWRHVLVPLTVGELRVERVKTTFLNLFCSYGSVAPGIETLHHVKRLSQREREAHTQALGETGTVSSFNRITKTLDWR
jgi:hypothetical protein